MRKNIRKINVSSIPIRHDIGTLRAKEDGSETRKTAATWLKSDAKRTAPNVWNFEE